MLDVIIKYLSYIISCAGGMLIVFDFMDKMYQSQYLRKSKKIVLYIVFTALWFCVSIIGIPIFNFTYFVIATFAIAFFVFGVKHLGEFLQIVIFIISYAACDTIISSALTVITGSIPIYSSHSTLLLFNVMIILTFMIAISKLLIIYYRNRKTTYMYKKQYIFLAALPILNVIVIYIIAILAVYKTDQSMIHYIMALMAVTSGVLSLAVFYFFDNISKSNQLENDITLMQQRVDMQYGYYQQLEIEYDSSQKIMHDIKNHIKVFERLYETGQAEEGLEYAKKIYEIVEELGLKFKSNNRILNIIINEKMKICERYQIEFIYSVENLDLGFIDDIDITAIFANILDNAIEACRQITGEKKQIELRVYQFNNMFIINLINDIEDVPRKGEEKFISSKKNHKAIGLSNVRTSVLKYDGDINIDVEQDKFSVSIIFPVKNRDQ
jgi:Histidine kinase-, DNA gyrase B-, and HSP90-like ATPase.